MLTQQAVERMGVEEEETEMSSRSSCGRGPSPWERINVRQRREVRLLTFVLTFGAGCSVDSREVLVVSNPMNPRDGGWGQDAGASGTGGKAGAAPTADSGAAAGT